MLHGVMLFNTPAQESINNLDELHGLYLSGACGVHWPEVCLSLRGHVCSGGVYLNCCGVLYKTFFTTFFLSLASQAAYGFLCVVMKYHVSIKVK